MATGAAGFDDRMVFSLFPACVFLKRTYNEINLTKPDILHQQQIFSAPVNLCSSFGFLDGQIEQI